MAVTLTACDSTAPSTAVPACPSQRPRARGEEAGERLLWGRCGLGWGVPGVSADGAGDEE